MYGTRNQVVLPLNSETKIKGDDPVFKLEEICDTLNYKHLGLPLAILSLLRQPLLYIYKFKTVKTNY